MVRNPMVGSAVYFTHYMSMGTASICTAFWVMIRPLHGSGAALNKVAVSVLPSQVYNQTRVM